MGQGIVRGRLRSQLLVGVATVALTIPVSRWAQAEDAAKWSPYIELGGMGGTRNWGDVDIFVPLWQDQGSLLFGDLRGTFTTQPTEEGNFGLGYRTQISPEWILGGYGYFDIQNSENDNLFYQVTVGAELKSVDWDFRVNGYIPINPDGGVVDSETKANIQITGNLIQLNSSTRKEKALYGVDGEVGWRVPVFPADGDMDIRLYAGGYYFTNSDVDTIAGPRGRIEARLYDIDFLGMQSRLTAQGVVQWDSPRGVQGFGGLELRIPLGAITGAPGPKLNPLDRRMVDRVQRDVDIVTELSDKKRQSEDVIVDELTVSTHTIVFANGTGGGSGTQESQTGLQGAPGLAPGLNGGTGSNAIIVADGSAGNIGVSNPLQLLPGQALIGGGSVVGLTGVKTHLHVNFLFPGSRPTLVGNGGGDLIVMASGSQNRITGLNLTGPFGNGIFGADMYRAIVTGNSIDGSQATGRGILLVDDPSPSEFIHITGNTIFNVPENAIEIDTTVASGAVFSQSVLIENNSITNTGIHSGIALYTFGESGSLVQNLAILGNTIDDTGSDGILIKNHVAGTSPNSLDQNGLIAGNHVTDVGSNGIEVANFAVGSGAVFRQAMAILGNTISDAAENGIAVTTLVQDAPGVTQTVAIDANWISHVGLNGIFFDAEVNALGGLPGGTASLAQTFAIDNNVISDTAENGIYDRARLFTTVGLPGVLTQLGEINGNQVTSTGVEGIVASTLARGDLVAGSNLSQTLHIDNNTVAHVNELGLEDGGPVIAGIHVVNDIYGLSHATQSIVIDPNIVSDVTSGNGIIVFNSLSNSTLSQSLEIASNVISGIYFGGVVVENTLRDFGADLVATSLSQAFNIAGNSVTGGSFGIVVFNGVATEGGDFGPVNNLGNARLTQVGLLSGNVVTDASSIGIAVFTNARGFGASFNQSLAAIGNTVNSIGSAITSAGTGIAFYTGLYRGARGTQNLLVADNSVSDVGRDGIVVGTVVSALGNSDATTLLTQGVTVTGNQVTGSGETGIRIGTYVSAAQIPDPLLTAGVVQTLQVGGNTVVDSGADGILVANNVFADGEGSSAFLSQSGTIAGNRVDGSVDDGIDVRNSLRATHSANATLSQSVAINSNIVTDSGVDGIHVDTSARATYSATATLIQSIAVNNNTVTSSGVDGILVETYASGYGFISNGTVRLTQTVVVDPNKVRDSAEDGIGVKTVVNYLGSSAVQSILIAANSVAGSSRDGVYVGTTMSAASMTQTVSVLGNSISGSGENGIEVTTNLTDFGYDGGTSLSQRLVIEGNRISDSGENGILVDNNVFADGEGGRVYLSQLAAIDGNVVSNSGNNGIAVDTQIQKTGYNATATVSQSIVIDDNTVANSGENGIQVSNDVFADGEGGHVFLSQLAAIDGNVISNSGENGILVDSEIRAVNYGTATVTQGIAIDDNTIANSGLDGILISTFASAEGGSFGGAVVNLNQAQTIDPNIITNSGVDGIAVKTQLYYVFNAQQSVSIAANVISASVRDGIYVGTSLRQGSSLSQSLFIADNSITHSGSNGIQVTNLAEDFGASLAQTAAIVGNNITSSGLNGIFVSNYVKGIGNNVINQSLAIAGNTVDTVTSAHVTAGTPSIAAARDGGNGILVRNNIAAYQGLVQSVAVQGNVVTNVRSFDGIYIKTLADKNASATQTFAVVGNHAFNNGGYGVALKTVVSDHVGTQNPAASISQSIAVTGNTLDNNLYGGLGVFVIASAGKVVQNGSIAGNILTNAKAHFGEGIDALGLAGSSAVVSQSFAVNNNFITGNAVGVYLRAGDRFVTATASNPAQILTGGTVSQSWTFTSNSILSNNANFVSGGTSTGGNGLYGLVSGGTGTTQRIDLVSGNVISGNSSDGVRLFAFGTASQTATLHSNLGVDPHNTITSNGTNLSSNGGVNQSVTP